jgi:hypothetical protein
MNVLFIASVGIVVCEHAPNVGLVQFGERSVHVRP